MSNKSAAKHIRENQKNSPLLELKDTISERLATSKLPYAICVSGILERFHHMHSKGSDRKFQNFVKKFVVTEAQYAELVQIPSLKGTYDKLVDILAFYYMMTEKSGQAEFKTSVNWLPVTKEQETMLNWPQNYICSIFKFEVKLRRVYYTDLRTNERYHVSNLDPAVAKKARGNQMDSVLTVIFPTDKGYVPAPPCYFQLGEDNRKQLETFSNDKIVWQQQIFKLFKGVLVENLARLSFKKPLD